MEGCEDVRFKKCAIIQFYTVEKIPPIDISLLHAGSVGGQMCWRKHS